MIDEDRLAALVSFHGHMCPGLAMGVHAAEIALREIGPHAADEEVVAVAETDMCATDAVQFLTGCTFGKGNLVHRDYGKNAYTFFRRSDGRAVRVAARPGAGPVPGAARPGTRRPLPGERDRRRPAGQGPRPHLRGLRVLRGRNDGNSDQTYHRTGAVPAVLRGGSVPAMTTPGGATDIGEASS